MKQGDRSFAQKGSFKPANPNLIPEARELVEYLLSVYGKKTLMGQDKFPDAEMAYEASGKYPAIVSVDLSGWDEVRWSEKYKATIQSAMERLIEWWKKQGGIASVAWHWAIPTFTEGTYKATKGDYYPIDVEKVITPGTPENLAAMEDIRLHADYLEILCKERVPVLWRPLHEIEGGWFWWTDAKKPENTAKLWKMMFDYLVHERKLDNLIWVYSSALKAAGCEDTAAVEERKRYYPGSEYVDIAGIDIYPVAGWKDFRSDAYAKAFDIMSEVAPGKMLALCECKGIPDPDIMLSEGPMWLWCLAWWVRDEEGYNTPEWVNKVYHHDFSVTCDQLPPWK